MRKTALDLRASPSTSPSLAKPSERTPIPARSPKGRKLLLRLLSPNKEDSRDTRKKRRLGADPNAFEEKRKLESNVLEAALESKKGEQSPGDQEHCRAVVRNVVIQLRLGIGRCAIAINTRQDHHLNAICGASSCRIGDAFPESFVDQSNEVGRNHRSARPVP